MKTYKEWAACYRHLDVYLKPGDEIDREMVNYFNKNALPGTRESGFIQFREPVENFMNAKQKFRTIHATIQQKDGQWIYAGLCFPGKKEPASHHIFVSETFRKTDFGMTFYKNISFPITYVKHRDHWYSTLSGKIDGIVRSSVIIHILDKNGRELSSEKTIPWDG